MYNKKTLTFTFHHYWGPFCQGAFVLGGLLSGELLSNDEK
jgi:hypothetical protein